MSPTEAALRAAVAAAPDAALPRLVLADHLDDHDFPHHAAALRLDAELAAERPWADRYWLLKAERDAHTPAGFPADLGWLSDRRPLLVGVPDDWRSRWRAVRAFVSRWWGVPLGDVGRWGAAVEEAERVAGRELPSSVKELVTFTADLANHPPTAEEARGWDRVEARTIAGRVTLGAWNGQRPLWTVGLNDLSPNPPALVHERPRGNRAGWNDPFPCTTADSGLILMLVDRGKSAVSDPDARRAELTADGGHSGRLGPAEVYEHPNWVIALLPSAWGFQRPVMEISHPAEWFNAQAARRLGIPYSG